jgi:hypothetical protein
MPDDRVTLSSLMRSSPSSGQSSCDDRDLGGSLFFDPISSADPGAVDQRLLALSITEIPDGCRVTSWYMSFSFCLRSYGSAEMIEIATALFPGCATFREPSTMGNKTTGSVVLSLKHEGDRHDL